MKGRVAIRTVILLVVAVLVIAVALYFLVYVTNFDSLFLSNDQRILKQYATCALAYCASGAGSDEVNAVGCLKNEGGRCVLTCAQVQEEIYSKPGAIVEDSFEDFVGRPHYCEPDAAIPFQFSGLSLGGIVPLKSGQMDKLANKPQWVCKPIKIPFTDIELDNVAPIVTADIQYHGWFGPQNCIMLSGSKGIGAPGRYGCFLPFKYDESTESTYYTPIMEFDYYTQILYPSAIYVSSGKDPEYPGRPFTQSIDGLSQAECDYAEPKPLQEISKEDLQLKVKAILQSSLDGYKNRRVSYDDAIAKVKEECANGNQDSCNRVKELEQKVADLALGGLEFEKLSTSYPWKGTMLSGCNFKTAYKGDKITYKVWAKPVFPQLDSLAIETGAVGAQKTLEGAIDALIKSLVGEQDPLFEALDAAGKSVGETSRTQLSQLGGSCTAVVLDRELETDSDSEVATESPAEILISTDKQIYLAGETIIFQGTLSGIIPIEGAEVRLELSGSSQSPLEVKTVETDETGNFVWEFTLPEGMGSGTYQIKAKYDGKEDVKEFILS